MIISTLSKKGGVGKTPISFSIAKDLDYNLVSNDNSIIDRIYDKAEITKKPIVKQNTVYDFGGFVDTNILSIIKASDLVIIPTIEDLNSILQTIQTIQEVVPYAKEIIIIATRTENTKDYEKIQTSINKYYPNMKIFELRKSAIFRNSLETGMSISEIVLDNKLNQHQYKNIFLQYNTILDFIKGL